MTATLLPTLLDHDAARWARASSLRLEPGRLVLVRGRRTRTYDVSGARVRPTPGAWLDGIVRPVVLKQRDGLPLWLDLAEWGPEEVTGEAFAAGLGLPWSEKVYDGERGERLTAADPARRRRFVGVVLLVVVLTVTTWHAGAWWGPAWLISAGVLAVAVVALGITPSRWWLRPRTVDDRVAYVVTPRRAGYVVAGAPTRTEESLPPRRRSGQASGIGLGVLFAIAAALTWGGSVTAAVLLAVAAGCAFAVSAATRIQAISDKSAPVERVF